jgi:hypothetical protein
VSSNHSRFIHHSFLLWLQQRHLIVKQRETWWKLAIEFCLSVSLSYLKGSLICCKILWHGANRFTSPPKEVMLWIFITLKNQSLLARFESTNLGPYGKKANHYTTKNDKHYC